MSDKKNNNKNQGRNINCEENLQIKQRDEERSANNNPVKLRL